MPKARRTLAECIIVNQELDGVQIVAKNRDRAYKPTLEVVHELIDDTEVAYLHDIDTDWSEGVNEYGIAIVNTALDTDFDENEGDRKKPITNRRVIRKDAKIKSNDGAIIRHALAQKTIDAAVKVLSTYKGGLAGHTIVATTKKVITIEYGTELKKPITPYTETHKPDEMIVRTNHGIHYPHIGYTPKNDERGYESSVERKNNAEAILRDVNDWHDVLPALRHQMFNKRSPLNLVRDTEGMWTTSQTLINLSSLMLEIDYFKNKIESMRGVTNKLPKNHKPKISVTVKEVAITNGHEGPPALKKEAIMSLATKLLQTLREISGGQMTNCAYEDWGELREDAEYQGHAVTLNKPFRSSDGKHKFYVYVKNDKNNVIKLGFGDPNMEIKRDDPARRKAYRDRHDCANPGPKWKAEYWSCRMWADKPVSKIAEATPSKASDIKCHECGRALTARERKANPSGVCDSCNLAARNAHDRARTFDEATLHEGNNNLNFGGSSTYVIYDYVDRGFRFDSNLSFDLSLKLADKMYEITAVVQPDTKVVSLPDRSGRMYRHLSDFLEDLAQLLEHSPRFVKQDVRLIRLEIHDEPQHSWESPDKGYIRAYFVKN